MQKRNPHGNAALVRWPACGVGQGDVDEHQKIGSIAMPDRAHGDQPIKQKCRAVPGHVSYEP
jgi:hypothetical protein